MARATKKTTAPETPKPKTSADMLGVYDNYLEVIKWTLEHLDQDYAKRRARLAEALVGGDLVRYTLKWEGENLIDREATVEIYTPMMLLWFTPTNTPMAPAEEFERREKAREEFAQADRRRKLEMLREANGKCNKIKRRMRTEMTQSSNAIQNAVSFIEGKAGISAADGYEEMANVETQFAHMERALGEAERLWAEENRAHPCQMCQQETNGEERSKVCTLEGIDYYVHKSCLFAGMKAEEKKAQPEESQTTCNGVAPFKVVQNERTGNWNVAGPDGTLMLVPAGELGVMEEAQQVAENMTLGYLRVTKK